MSKENFGGGNFWKPSQKHLLAICSLESAYPGANNTYHLLHDFNVNFQVCNYKLATKLTAIIKISVCRFLLNGEKGGKNALSRPPPVQNPNTKSQASLFCFVKFQKKQNCFFGVLFFGTVIDLKKVRKWLNLTVLQMLMMPMTAMKMKMNRSSRQNNEK